MASLVHFTSPGVAISGGGSIATFTPGSGAGKVARADLGRNTGKWKFRVTLLNPQELGARTYTGGGFMTSGGLLNTAGAILPGNSLDVTNSTIFHAPLGGFVWYECHYFFLAGDDNFLINYLRCTSITFAVDCDAKKYWFCCRTETGEGAPFDSGWLYAKETGLPTSDPDMLVGYDYGARIADDTIYPFAFSDFTGGQVQVDFAPGDEGGCVAAEFQDWDTAVEPASSDDTHVFAA